jgi:hypothetical protein
MFAARPALLAELATAQPPFDSRRRDRRETRSLQPSGESPARESKENQRKKLGLPWIPLAESGLFRGLQVKK